MLSLLMRQSWLQIPRNQEIAADPADAEVPGDMGLPQVHDPMTSHHSRSKLPPQNFRRIEEIELID